MQIIIIIGREDTIIGKSLIKTHILSLINISQNNLLQVSDIRNSNTLFTKKRIIIMKIIKISIILQEDIYMCMYIHAIFL